MNNSEANAAMETELYEYCPVCGDHWEVHTEEPCSQEEEQQQEKQPFFSFFSFF